MRKRARATTCWTLLPLLALAAGCDGMLMEPGVNEAAVHTSEAPVSTGAGQAVCVVAQAGPERDGVLPAPAAARLLAQTQSYPGPCFTYGEELPLGAGAVRTYAQLLDGEPLAMGVVFPASTLTNMPTAPSDGNHCFDVDGNGVLDPMQECVGGHERVMQLPTELVDGVPSPFQWVLMNWNPMGHPPPMVYTVPHFDFHFYIQDLEERNEIDAGACALLIDCDDFVTASVPVPPEYLPQDYQDLGAAEAAMGNHLIDLNSPEFTGMPFSHTFIYGAWDGDITFYEPMITLAWFQGLANGTIADDCWDLKLPQAWKDAGHYPTRYCIRYRENRQDYTVSLEGFVYRTAG